MKMIDSRLTTGKVIPNYLFQIHSKRLNRLPDVMTINCQVDVDKHREFWNRKKTDVCMLIHVCFIYKFYKTREYDKYYCLLTAASVTSE